MSRWLKKTQKKLNRWFSMWFEDLRRRNSRLWWSVWDWFAWLKRLEPSESDVVRRVSNRDPIRLISLFNPLFWLLNFLGFVLRYVASRSLLNLLKATPAVFGLVAPVVLAVWVAPGRDAQVARASSRMGYFQERKEYAEADFFSRQLCLLAPDDDDAVFRRAQLLELMENKPAARQLLMSLASDRNHLPAIRLMCQQDLQELVSSPTPPEGLAASLENNLQQLVVRFPADNMGRFMLATFYMQQQKPIEAVSLLQSITKSATDPLPQVWYSQAMLQWQLGRDQEARQSAAMASDQFLQANVQQTLSVPDFLQAIRAMVLANREDEALQLLEPRLRAASDDQERLSWLSLKGEICAAWSRRLGSREGVTPAEIARSIQILFEGIKAAPGQQSVVDELCRLCISNRVSRADVDRHLQQAINSGVSPGLVHFILGSRAATQSPPDAAAADEHFKLAVAHDANFPGLLNNMANLIADSPEADYEEGIKLVQQALKLLPNQPEIHDTHGKLLLKLGQPTQAIAAFEKALAAPAIRAEVHANIAKAWTVLGDPQKAQSHQQMADSLAKTAVLK